MNRIGALIPIRLGSERLPGKALKSICGRPVVHHLLDRVVACRFIAPRDTVVCTTCDAADDPLVAAVEAYGASVFRGAADDIVARFHAAVTQFGFDAVVQVNGDNPLSATEYMDLTMQTLCADPALDIVTCTGLPLGIAVTSFTARALARVHDSYRTTANDTGFIYYFTRTGLCEHREIRPATPDHVLNAARLTLDYPEDLAVFRCVFEALGASGRVFGLSEAIAYLKANPDVMALNRHLDEGYWRRTEALVNLEYADAAGVIRRIAF